MDACRDKLATGLEGLGLPIDLQQQQALLDFIKLIVKWNKAYNLTAVRDPLEMVSLHILDSLAVMPHIQPPQIIDIGTGAGLPGIPLAICMPDCRFTLLDSNAKKTRFVTQAVLELQLKNVEVVQSRAELYKPEQLFTSVITRAFAAIPEILALTKHLLAEGGLLMAMKGLAPEQELAELALAYRLISLKVPGIEAERCLICLEKP